MTNEITITVDEILKQDADSITDPETIRQIALLMRTVGDFTSRELSRRIKTSHQFFGLYPDVMEAHNIEVDLDKNRKDTYGVFTYDLDYNDTCPLCNGTKEISMGGSFGGGLITKPCTSCK